ncbi:uncharacterized protein LOC113231830 [Hyposmocoma kahamanoa]|uniref:uncharacterized protein LOC113231830 n=1 Tax=Hyposmocoma kahamanoa TaxID=1477025 RepID=UPI000E6DA241|nr:uncharacterized protein LOC113231830 [Hyposmocoma kahamanoa]
MFLRVVIILAKSVFIHAALLQITCQHIKRFVDGHNRVRLAVAQGKVPNQPAGNNIKLMMWDEELARKAAKWAERNVLQHDRDMTIPSQRFISGENLCLHRSFVSKSTFNPDETIQVWYEEHKKYTYDKMSYNGFTSIGHYTQRQRDLKQGKIFTYAAVLILIINWIWILALRNGSTSTGISNLKNWNTAIFRHLMLLGTILRWYGQTLCTSVAQYLSFKMTNGTLSLWSATMHQVVIE